MPRNGGAWLATNIWSHIRLLNWQYFEVEFCGKNLLGAFNAGNTVGKVTLSACCRKNRFQLLRSGVSINSMVWFCTLHVSTYNYVAKEDGKLLKFPADHLDLTS